MTKTSPNDDLVLNLYTQAQLWLRHNEDLIIKANSILVSIMSISTVVFFRDSRNLSTEHIALILIAVSITGILLNSILKNRFLESLDRVIKYEKILGTHKSKNNLLSQQDYDEKWGTALTPKYLHSPPSKGPEIYILFQAIYILTFTITFTLLTNSLIEYLTAC
ncbi:hypothetical protein [Bacterioplanoides sp. SCSIO 12839]|uniref:hypothetical protein n=1 Tax=Bacterioplanoides sp. SCSIO 12839 TaxID=2829569 RepID=UPI0021040C03|nr:hypothetical protein [Bacterioplanoides sp. SCSIO 12839]UTW48919.1 hypothetical protein KFF03_03145 [Bacterioplanoides sp. SCSIO 12839]